MRTLILGARGQLGAALVQEFGNGHEVVPLTHQELDITAPSAVARTVARHKPDVIVNAAGFNAVDAAEEQPLPALQVNAFAVRSLANAARGVGAVLVQYSSDFVFDGTATHPHLEDDRPNPRSTYAATKLLGEWFAADAPSAYVLRVESLFGSAPGGADRGSAAAIVDGLRRGSQPKVFEDRTVSPTYVHDAARATRQLLDRRPPAGLYHCVNSGSCTWLEFAMEAAQLLGVEPRVERVRLADLKLRAPRPLYCALSNAKLAAAGIAMRPWQEALREYLAHGRN